MTDVYQQLLDDFDRRLSELTRGEFDAMAATLQAELTINGQTAARWARKVAAGEAEAWAPWFQGGRIVGVAIARMSEERATCPFRPRYRVEELAAAAREVERTTEDHPRFAQLERALKAVRKSRVETYQETLADPTAPSLPSRAGGSDRYAAVSKDVAADAMAGLVSWADVDEELQRRLAMSDAQLELHRRGLGRGSRLSPPAIARPMPAGDLSPDDLAARRRLLQAQAAASDTTPDSPAATTDETAPAERVGGAA